MSQFINQYFDFNFMSTTSTRSDARRSSLTLELSVIGGVLSLIWGLILSLLRQLPGEGAGARSGA